MSDVPFGPEEKLVEEILERMDDLVQMGVGEWDTKTMDLFSDRERMAFERRAEALGVDLGDALAVALEQYAEAANTNVFNQWMERSEATRMVDMWQNTDGAVEKNWGFSVRRRP